MPKQFEEYVTYVKNLKFEEKPDYAYLRRLFRLLFVKNNYKFDEKYD